MKKEAIEKFVLIVLIAGALLYSYVTYLFLPEWQNIQLKRQELAKQQKYVTQLLQYKQNAEGLQSEIQKLEIESSQLSAQIPFSIDKPQLMVKIYSLAKESGVQPQTLTFEQPEKTGTYQSITMNFSGLGNISDILTFMKKAQTNNQLRFAIQSVNLTNQQGKIKADFKLVAYASDVTTEKPVNPPSLVPPVPGLDSIGRMFSS